jgi:molybdenum-dependent DNA-binding transcriptional regulator ModE
MDGPGPKAAPQDAMATAASRRAAPHARASSGPGPGAAPDACGPVRWLCALRTFRAVIREHGFTAAARRLGVSQGAVSQQMRCLEAQFGVRLLERSAHRIALTAAGERLLWHAERLLAAQDAMLAEMTRLRAEGGVVDRGEAAAPCNASHECAADSPASEILH